MKKVLGSILFVIYAVIAITVTVLLLSYNEYNNSELGGYTVYLVNDDSLEPNYKQGSILLIKSTSDKNVQIGDELFLYKVINSQEYHLVEETLEEKTQQGNHIIYSVGEDQNYASDYFVGKASDTVVIEGWGYVLGLLESKWGYLFCVVIVSLLLFLQEAFDLAMEIKYLGEKKKEAQKKQTRKKKKVVEVEYEEDDDSDEDEEEEIEEVVEVKPRKKKTSTKNTVEKTTTTKPKTTSKKTTTAKTTTSKPTTPTSTKSATTKTKKTTSTKSATASSKKNTTKSAKEEK